MVEYLALGPVSVIEGDAEIALGGENQRRLLATLIAHRGREVTVLTIAEALWPTRPPTSEIHAVQTVVSRTRRALGPHRHELTTTPDGYRLDPTACDVVRFESLLADAASQTPDHAASLRAEALALWRGPAFGALATIDAIRTEAIRLDELHLTTMEDRLEHLTGTDPAAAVAPLESLVATHPLRERARALLMRALYVTGRQADALAVYSRYRDLIGEEMGLEPSPELRSLEEAIVLDSLPRPAPSVGGGPRLAGRLGDEIGSGPPAADLEEDGWRRLWDLDHDGSVASRQRAYVRHLEHGDRRAAARVAIWLGVNAAIRLRNAVAFGWLGRAQHLLEGVPPGPEHGLLLGLIGMVEVLGGDLDGAIEHSTDAERIGMSCGDPDAEALGKAVRGWASVRLGRVRTGLALLDQAMASAVAGEIGDYVAALVYCRTLCACLDLMDYQRATEWTGEIARVRAAGGPSDLPGDCRTHRLAVMVANGDWDAGEEEAALACSETGGFDMTHLALATALRGEILLRRGDLDGAEADLWRAHEMGASPQPGLALVHLARGDATRALEMITDAVDETTHDPLRQAHLLPALVEIAIANGEPQLAADAATTLRATADRYGTSALHAHARRAQGDVQMASGAPGEAVRTLRGAWRRWQEVGSVYRAARTRVALADALLASGRRSDAAAEAEAARRVLADIGAEPDVRVADRILSATQG